MIGSFIILSWVFLIGLTLPKYAHGSFFLAMAIRLVISSLNVSLAGKLIGADGDANRFFNESVYRSSSVDSIDWNISSLLDGSHGFINVHAIIQGLLGPNFFLGHAFSLLGTASCLWLLTRICLLCCPNDKKYVNYTLLIYAFVPSVATFQSYILREVWQSFCILGVAYASLKIRSEGWSFRQSLNLIFFSLIGIFLHSSMPIVMPLFLLIGILLATGIRVLSLPRKPVLLLKIVLVFLSFVAVLYPFFSESPYFTALMQGDLFVQTDTYTLRALQQARAEYGKMFYLDRPWTILQAFLAYQLMPFPFMVETLSDTVLLLENLFRVWLLSVYCCRRKYIEPSTRTKSDLLLLMWFWIELVWSVGTINWGTAARHHVPAFGLLLCCGLLAQFKYLECKRMRKKRLTRQQCWQQSIS